MDASIFQTVAQSFLEEYPKGTIVTDSELQEWVQAHPDGAVIKPDLAIQDPKKRVSALRRHLNDGARSNALSEDERFVLEIEDAKRGTYIVTSYSDAVQAKANNAVSKSVRGAISPLISSKRAIDSVKLDELPDIERETLEIARDNISAMEQAIKPTLAQEVKRIWIAKLAVKGISAEHALKLLETMPELNEMKRLIKITS